MSEPSESWRDIRRLLFVCTGNTCRSPMAEVLARAEAERRGLAGVESRSAGAYAWGGQPAAGAGIVVAGARGLDLGEHRSTPLDEPLAAWADLVLGMDAGHVEAVRKLSPEARVAVITEFLPPEDPRHGASVTDPIGGDRDVYEETFELLERAVRGLFDRIAPEGSSGGDRAPVDP